MNKEAAELCKRIQDEEIENVYAYDRIYDRISLVSNKLGGAKMENKQRKEFTELARAKIRDNRNIIISKDNTGFITIAQQLVIVEDGRETAVFLKGAIEIEEANLENVERAILQALEAMDK